MMDVKYRETGMFVFFEKLLNSAAHKSLWKSLKRVEWMNDFVNNESEFVQGRNDI